MANDPARPGPYTDTSITLRNPPHVDITPDPKRSGSTTLGGVTVYKDDQADDIDSNGTFIHTDPPPHASNSWQPGHDLYANNGNVTGHATTGTPGNDDTPLRPGQVLGS